MSHCAKHNMDGSSDHSSIGATAGNIISSNGSGGVAYTRKRYLYSFSCLHYINDDNIAYLASWGWSNVQSPSETRFTKGNISRLNTYVVLNTITETVTLEVLKNGVGTGIIISYTSEETGSKTLVCDVDVADGDLLTVKAIVPNTGPPKTIRIGQIEIEFEETI